MGQSVLWTLPLSFMRWWGRELLACVPRSLRAALAPNRRALAVQVEGDRVIIRRQGGRGAEIIGEIAPGRAQDAAARRLLRRAGRGTVSKGVLISRAQSLHKIVSLPPAAAENLREVLAFEMDRLTPFKAADVYYDYRVVEPGGSSDRQAERLDVDLLVAAKADVDRAVATVRAWGVDPDFVSVAEPPGAETQGAETPGAETPGAETPRAGTPRVETLAADFNLLPRAVNTGGRFAAWASGGLAVVVVALALVALVMPLQLQQRTLARVEADAAAARAAAFEVDALRSRLAEVVERGDSVAARKNSEPSVVALLDEVTRRLPDETWLVQLSRRGDELTMSGFSSKATALISRLENSALFTNVQFGSPVTLDRNVDLERFNITAVLRAEEG